MEDLIPLLAIFCIFGMPVLAFIIVRSLQHKERIEMIRHGYVPPTGSAWKDWTRNAGTAPIPPSQPQRVGPIEEDDPQRTLRKGIVVAFIGFAITLGLSFIGYDNGHFTPGPWLLGGLIPMFIGLAQVLTAIMFGATFPAAAQTRRYGPGPVPGPGTAAPPPPFDTSYTYRPDPSTQELGSSSPPDRR